MLRSVSWQEAGTLLLYYPLADEVDVRPLIKEAHEKYKNQNATDDTQLVKSLGYRIKIVPGKEQLLKLTKLEDTNALEAYIEQNEYLQN